MVTGAYYFLHVLLHLLGHLVIHTDNYLLWCRYREQFVPVNTFCSWCEKEKGKKSQRCFSSSIFFLLFFLKDTLARHFGRILGNLALADAIELPRGSLLFMWLNWGASGRLCFNCCHCELSAKWKEGQDCGVPRLSDWWQTYQCEQSSQIQIYCHFTLHVGNLLHQYNGQKGTPNHKY